MKEEILSAQQQLRTLCGQLRQQERRQRRNSSDSGHGGGPSSRLTIALFKKYKHSKHVIYTGYYVIFVQHFF